MGAHIIDPDHSFAVGVVARHHAANVDGHHCSPLPRAHTYRLKALSNAPLLVAPFAALPYR
jgi:hypothetical protein